MKKNDDNILSDIEDDIFGDWKNIQKQIKDKEFETKAMKNPQRLDCPDFMEFYKILLQILQSWDFDNPEPRLLLNLHSLLRMVFNDIEDWPNPLPKSFHRIWELFCNPRFYKCELNQKCQCCNKSWDIVFKQNLPRVYDNLLDGGDRNADMYAETTRISCPDCGYPMRSYMGRKVVGIFRSVHDGEMMKGHDIRREF